MVVRGRSGELRISGRLAAQLGRWSFERDSGAPDIEVEARVLRTDQFLITRGLEHMRLRLDIQNHKERAVSGLRIDDGTVFITANW